MGLNPPVPQQDSNWEIRAAVLLSLFFQVLLIFLGPTRKRSSAPLFRLTVWSCYLLADWVADLALGLLLNNMGNIGGNNDNTGTASSPVIFAFWTPFLLLHLGGPDTITAFSVEDNELWNRHLIGLLFELFSATVIIFCSLHLHGNPLVPATMLMLVAGVIKYGERTYSLYAASAESLRDSILAPPEPGPNYSRLVTELDSKKKAGLPVELVIYSGDAELAERQQAERLVMDKKKSVEARAYEFFLTFRRLLVDVIISSKERRLSQAFFLRDTEETRMSDEDEGTVSQAFFLRETDPDDEPTTITKLFEVMAVELNFMYDMVYTKAPVAHSKAGWVVRCICSGCLISALAVFFFIDKPGHQILRVDVGITYALLLGGLALDVTALLMIFFSNRAQVYLETNKCWRRLRWLARLRKAAKRWRTRRWSGTISQMNLIRYCQEKPGPYSRGGKWWLMIVKMLGVEEIVDDFVFIRRVRLEKDKEEEGCGCLRRFFRTLVPKCCKNDNNTVSESLLFGFFFRGLKGVLRHLKEEQEERKKAAAAHKEERKKAAAAQKLLKMEQEAKAAAPAPAAGTPDQEATTEEEEMEAEKEAMTEKDAIAEVCRRRGDGVVKSYEGDIKLAKATTTDGDGAKSHEDDIKQGKGTKEGYTRFKVILDSVTIRDFDESLLLWHIATDLCLDRPVTIRNYQGPMPKEIFDMRAIAETLSEYMLYLLIKQPDMLAATAGIGLRPFRDTCAEARQFFASKEAWIGIDKNHAMRTFLLSVNTSTISPASMKGDRSKSVLFDAVILAKALRQLDEEVMWDVITGVWGEMLTFAAVSGRGRTHVRNLSRGGELITFVWLLMQHMGLSTMYEIQQGDPSAQLIVHY